MKTLKTIIIEAMDTGFRVSKELVDHRAQLIKPVLQRYDELKKQYGDTRKGNRHLEALSVHVDTLRDHHHDAYQKWAKQNPDHNEAIHLPDHWRANGINPAHPAMQSFYDRDHE